MAYIDRHLTPKEKILYRGQIHWIVFMCPVLLTLFWLIFLRQAGWWVILLPVWLYYFCQYVCAEVVVTNRRLVAKYGMIAVKSASMDLTGIEGVRNDVSILGRILGYGTLMACGKGGKNIGIADLADPEKFQNALYEAMESSK